jgi:hypothetical protein
MGARFASSPLAVIIGPSWEGVGLRLARRLAFLLVVSAVVPACEIGPKLLLPPADPTNLTLTPISSAQIKLDWTDAATNESSYFIERSLDGITWIQLAILPLNPPDLWALNLGSPSNWVLMIPFGPAPSARRHHSAVYDAWYHRMVMFGGDLGTDNYTDELWWIVQ